MNKEEFKGIPTYVALLREQTQVYIKSKLKEAGNRELYPSYGSLLAYVYNHGGKVQIKELYEALLKQKSTITEMIKRLVALGYLTKESCAEDRRVTYVVATDKAWAFRDAFFTISGDTLDKVLEGFTEEEAREFQRLIRKAIANFTE